MVSLFKQINSLMSQVRYKISIMVVLANYSYAFQYKVTLLECASLAN